MPRKLTEYSLLFSCPGDAYKTCYSVILEAVTDFNKYAMSNLAIRVNLTHWSTDSFPQSGGHPQALLNNQIVYSADAAIAVFWTRFGTPTDEFGSGTEEEIESLLSENKQVFLYFLDKAVPPSMTDSDDYHDQRKQINAFRKKYEDRGIYRVVINEEELKQLFSKHLILYFANLMDANAKTLSDSEKSELSITAVDGTTEIHIKHLNISDEMGIETQRSLIIRKIKSAINIELPNNTTPVESGESTEVINVLTFITTRSTTIRAEEKKVILDFCTANGISIGDELWYLGELRIHALNLVLSAVGEPRDSLVGSEAEKRKYNLLRDIIADIYLYNDRMAYCYEMNNLPYSELIIKNDGTAFDEDIEIRLCLPTGSLLKAEEFPIPMFDLKQINEEDRLQKWICPIATSDISEFDYSYAEYSSSSLIPQMPILLLQQRDHEAEIKREKKRYIDRLNDFFEWEIFKEQSGDIIKFHVRKLNQFKATHFPAKLFFAEVPKKISYSIMAKHTSSIIKGEITICE